MAPPAKQDVGQRVCLGVVVGAHGVRGMLRIKPFTEQAEDVGAYGPVEDEAGRRRFELTIHGVHKGVVLASVKDVADRDAAMALKGTRLYVDRSVLPALEEEDTFYHADLIGLPVEDRQGRPLGRVVAVADHGAGDLLELADDKGRERVLPFTREAVPVVDLAAGRIVAEPPEEVGEPEPADNAADNDGSEGD
ncbi:ribosome maturation factor RimM [Ferruginivarius sediminum]|uniref:Ribosome maturation factor RimM n=1 Tax=Ferruginivarius sediminum TaxID=2661937 RepID=A0A369TH80_9PROT|nr:ribosome maturation factor RimM [Ferruginivarius sediminum]RDD63497.1 16S rRNA processing protein RimM [Ferruginivarius sediminum]